MAIKCILVPIAAAPEGSVTMRATLRVAEPFSAEIQVLYAQSLAEDSKPVSRRGLDTVAWVQIVAAAQEASKIPKQGYGARFRSCSVTWTVRTQRAMR